MVTKEDILRCLNNDDWFIPNTSDRKAIIKDVDGKDMEVPESYYHQFKDNGQILIRVSDHGTHMETWIGRKADPSKSLQNLSVVFSKEPVTFQCKTKPHITKDEKGKLVTRYTYFAIEQYEYNINKLSFKDFLKVIKVIKSLESYGVFNDPLKKKPSKKANRRVMTPLDKNGAPISSGTTNIHDRQKVVIKNPNREVDANGNVTEARLQELIQKCIDGYLRRVL